MAMIAMTTSSSMRVNPCSRSDPVLRDGSDPSCLVSGFVRELVHKDIVGQVSRIDLGNLLQIAGVRS